MWDEISRDLVFRYIDLKLAPSEVFYKTTTGARSYGSFLSTNSVTTLGVLTVRVKARCVIGGVWLNDSYLQYIHSPRNFQNVIDCPGSMGPALWSCLCTLSDLVTWWSLLYADVQILRQAQYFGHSGGLRCALITWQVR